MTGQGTDGPCAFEASLAALVRCGLVCGEARAWFEVARESAPGYLLPLEAWQERALAALARVH